jgi:OOP family OmpA-OmpF porin
MRIATTILVFVCGVLLSAGIHRGSSVNPASPLDISPLDSVHFSITMARRQLSIRGTTVSAAHERSLRTFAEEHLGDHELQTEFNAGVLPGSDWEAMSNRLLNVVAAMDSATAMMDTSSVAIRGVSSDAAAFGSHVEQLRQHLPKEMEFTADVVFVRSRASFDELCQKAFAKLVFEPVSFAESSAEIRPASFVTLDRITEFAHDCQSVTIAITGHTDSSGHEAWNRQLSLARAQSVADHIASNGIDMDRLVVAGLGSSAPIADNSTAQGRELNRRIEFELR